MQRREFLGASAVAGLAAAADTGAASPSYYHLLYYFMRNGAQTERTTKYLGSALLRAFEGMPSVVLPPGDTRRPAKIFELRTYESTNEKASNRKKQMFEGGEIAIFRRLGMNPVLFGQATLLGQKLPHITYMLAFDDLAAREKLWKDFGADPAWRKLRAQPGLSDAEIVSNITNSIIRPLNFSEIR